MIKVGFLAEGSFLPIRNGGYYSIFNLMKALQKTRQIKPSLIFCYRGWDNPSLYYNQFFKTFFIKPEDYYLDTGVLEYVCRVHNISHLHIYNTEEVINIGARIKRAGVKVIYEAINIDHVLYQGLGLDKKSLLKMRRQQEKAFAIADYILCRSQIDYQHILSMGVRSRKVRIYRGAIDFKTIEYSPRKKPRHKIVFLGHMYYPPNEQALIDIATIILPQLKRIDPRYSVTIIGIAPESQIKKYSRYGIKFINGVDKLGQKLQEYDIAIAPLTAGSGTRLKVLDYLASGLPVITTSIGVEGLLAEIKRCVTIEDSIDSYAQVIHRVMTNLDSYTKISRAGRDFVVKQYNWDDNLKPFFRIYNSL